MWHGRSKAVFFWNEPHLHLPVLTSAEAVLVDLKTSLAFGAD